MQSRHVKIPCGSSYLEADIDADRLLGVLVPPEMELKEVSEEQIISEAILYPINSKRLCELAKGKQHILVITSDHTRPVPSQRTLPILLKEIRRGSPEAEVIILIATGTHRDPSAEEMVKRFGSLLETEDIRIHDSRDERQLYSLGRLPSGGDLRINKLVQWSDMIVSEGFIEPHFFAGFSGGRKSILPGIADAKGVAYNHQASFIDHEKSRTGVLKGNLIHRDMEWAAKEANLSFILNVVVDEDKKVIAAFAGEPVEAHAQGCQFVSRRHRVKRIEADIVITSNGGYPLDMDIYQSVKGMTAAEACVREGGVIIMVSESINGHGGESFYKTFDMADTPQGMLEFIRQTPAEETQQDMWQTQIFARVLQRATVIFVGAKCPKDMIEHFMMLPADDINAALEKAERIVGADSRIVVIPDGVAVIVE